MAFVFCVIGRAISHAFISWRKLEGSDPESYEMLQKIQTLQKRLILKTEEVVEKNLQIQEKEKLYVELKTILARQPGAHGGLRFCLSRMYLSTNMEAFNTPC